MTSATIFNLAFVVVAAVLIYKLITSEDKA